MRPSASTLRSSFARRRAVSALLVASGFVTGAHAGPPAAPSAPAPSAPAPAQPVAPSSPSSPVGPTPTPTPEDTATRDAKQRFEEGLKRFEAGDFEGARLAFVQAYAVLRAVDVLFNLAVSELRSGHEVEALTHFREYLRDPRISEPERAKATKYLAEANAKTGHVWIVAPDGSTVIVDARELAEKAPLKEAVDVTAVVPHVIEVRGGDGATRTLNLDVPAGQIVTARFAAGAPSATVSSGPPGPAEPERTSVAVTTPTPSAAVSPARLVTTIALGGVAVVSLATGVGFLVAAGGEKDRLDRAASVLGDSPSACLGVTNPTCTEVSDAAKTRNGYFNAATGFLVAGGLLAAGSVATWFLWPKSEGAPVERASARFAPALGPGMMGARVEGRF